MSAFQGARAIFQVDGRSVGYAAGVSGEESIDYEPIDVLGLLEVKEHVPTAYRVSLTAQMFRVVGESLKGVGILPRQEYILTSGVMDAVIIDKVTGATVQQFQGVRCAGHSFDFTARGVTQENVQFVAIRARDESEIPA